MTERDRVRRLATIKRLVRRNAWFDAQPEQGSRARRATVAEVAELEQRGIAAGAEWVARHRGIIGAGSSWDKYPMPRSWGVAP